MSEAWFQCPAGASAEMLLGALVAAGAPLETLQQAVDALAVSEVRLSAEQVGRHGLAATRVTVEAVDGTVVHTWGNIRAILDGAALPEPVRSRALDVFARLARAEAATHHTTPEVVHLHAVGVVEALAAVVGTCAALYALRVTAATGSPVAVGSGMARGEHGLLPVPAPAVVSLFAEAGAPMYSGDAPHELCTPIGAALLVATCTRWGGLPMLRVTASGLGAGIRDLSEVPNLVRVVIGDRVAQEGGSGEYQPALLLEANLDDLDRRQWPPVLRRLLDAGAYDAWLTPVLTSRGRPAHTLSVLLPEEAAVAVRQVISTDTSATGLRQSRISLGTQLDQGSSSFGS